MKKFLKYYKWELDNELFASIYFVAILSIYSIEVLLYGERVISIFVMLEMLLLSYGLSTFQKFIFSERLCMKSLPIRSWIWFVYSMTLSVVFSIAFHWFSNLQPWAMYVYIICMILVFSSLWIGIHVANNIDTKNLNYMLSRYQENSIYKEENSNE